MLVIKKRNFIPILTIIVFFLFIFFLTRDVTIFTPDFGQSDAYHGGLSMKFFLKQEYQANKIPLWSEKVQSGYPMIAFIANGSFYFLNFVLLKFFPFPIAFNLLYCVSFIILSSGLYLLLREFKISQLLALLISLNFPFNGSISLRLVHCSIIFPFSLVPLVFYLNLKLIKNGGKINSLLLIILLSQMILAGHPQIFFNAIFGLFLFNYIYFFHININKKNNQAFKEKIKKICSFIIFIFISFLISTFQIYPVFQLGRFTGKPMFLDYSTATLFPFNLDNLINFVLPEFFGNPKYGTYPPFSENWGIFWENTPYIGQFFFILLMISLLINIILKTRILQRPNKKIFFLNTGLSIFFIILAFGKNSPLYFVFEFPPFNIFRTQARYLMMAVFFMFIASSIIFQRMWQLNVKLKIIIVIALFLNLIQLLSFVYRYHLFLPYKKVLAPPTLSRYIEEDKYYVTAGQITLWNGQFLKKGWLDKDSHELYLFFRNFLFPNSNLIFNKKIFGGYLAGLELPNINYINNLILEDIQFDNQGKFILGDRAVWLMRLYNIKYFIFLNKLQNSQIKIRKIVKYSGKTIYLHELKNFTGKNFYIPKNLVKLNSIQEFAQLAKQIENLENTSLFEDFFLKKLSSNNTQYKIVKSQKSEDSFFLEGDFKKETLVVFKANFYPLWVAKVNKQQTKIFKINLTHIGIIVPPGYNKIWLQVSPSSFNKTLIFSIVVFLSFVFLVLISDKRFFTY